MIILTGTTNKRIIRLKQFRNFLVIAAILLSIVVAVSGFFLFRNFSLEEVVPANPAISEPTEEAVTQPTAETVTFEENVTEEETLAEEETVSAEEMVVPEEAIAQEPSVQPPEETVSHPDTDQLIPFKPQPAADNLMGDISEPAANSTEAILTEPAETLPADIAQGIFAEEFSETVVQPVETDASDFRAETTEAAEAEEDPSAASAETLPAGTEASSAIPTETAPHSNVASQKEAATPPWLILLFYGSACLLLMDVISICIISAKIQKLSRQSQDRSLLYGVTVKNVSPNISGIPSVGRSHNIGMRNYQQDSFGQTPILNNQGLLAVVADGMGGLSNGEKVSQRIVMKALDYGVRLTNTPNADTLVHMVNVINQDINQMLGEENLFKSGSTLVATMVVKDHLWWASVGDSRIYLYRNGYLNQLTRDHDLLQEWMTEVNKGRMSYEQAVSNPDGRKLTSFIGMGKLRYIGYNNVPFLLHPGDRILLMSDGVYNTVSNDEMIQILKTHTNVQDAADAVSGKIEATKRRHQDNYTIMILGM